MKKHLKKYFIPHEENEHKPHFLRKDSLAFIIATFVIFEGALLIGSSTIFNNSNFLAAVLPSTLVSLTNENRVAYKVKELKENPLLARAAELKALDMAAKGYFAHTSPDGTTPWHWLNLAGYSYRYAGENLAVNFIDSKDVSDAWMNSPAHKQNITSGNYSEIGIGTAEGMYRGQNVTFVVQFFGEPLAVSNDKWLATLLEKSKADVVPPVRATVANKPKPPVLPTSIPNEPIPPFEEIKGETFTSVAIADPKSVDENTTPENNTGENKQLLKVLESPRGAIATMLLAAVMLLSVALALAILIKIKIQHPRMIAGTLLVIFIALGILYINSEIFVSMTEVPTDTNSASIFMAF